MPVSAHSHSGQFCRHAEGTLEEMVTTAIAEGFETYALTEHVPRFDRRYLYPEENDMPLEALQTQFAGFLAEADRLQQKYAGQIDLVIGCETEYVNASDCASLASYLASVTQGRHVPLMTVGSVHHVHEHPFDFSANAWGTALASFGGDPVAMYCAYYDAHLAMVDALTPRVIGHLDLIGKYASAHGVDHLATVFDARVWPRVVRNVDRAIAVGALVEISARGFPHARVAERIASECPNVQWTLSDDAHAPAAVGLGYLAVLPAYVAEVGIASVWQWNSRLEKVEVPVGGSAWTRFFAGAERRAREEQRERE
ncbi:Polymerase/histidinol phosphatase-like protein [Blastocladiella britannica]|nr:Polymerase/histidinol phosphatase-like protein [Blastocladiella britannica]